MLCNEVCIASLYKVINLCLLRTEIDIACGIVVYTAHKKIKSRNRKRKNIRETGDPLNFNKYKLARNAAMAA